MDLDRCCDNQIKRWSRQDIKFYDTLCGRFIFKEYKFMRWMHKEWIVDDELWVDNIPLKDLQPYQGNPILVELDKGFLVIPGTTRDQANYIGRHQQSLVKRFKFLHNPHKNNIISYLERTQIAQASIDRELLCLINYLNELPTIMTVLRSLWKNESDTITFSDISPRILQSVSQMSINYSSLSQLMSKRFVSTSKKTAGN